MIDNREIIEHLQFQASELARSGASLFRVRAYRLAAEAIWRLDRSVQDMVENEPKALACIPGIGKHLAELIGHYVQTGQWQTFAELHEAK